MLYGEFLKGTGCKDNDINYKIYKELEIIYMNTDCTKEHIYEYGKKLVDNRKSSEQNELENKIKQEIQEQRELIEYYRVRIEFYKQFNDYGEYDREIKDYKQKIKQANNSIKSLQWVLR